MKIISINIGKIKKIQWQKQIKNTAFLKEPINEPIDLFFNGLKGDQQANKKYHGGETKAIYSYNQAYYEHWKTVLTDYNFTPGNFGENLLTKDFTDDKAIVGDIYKVGSAVVQVTEPRFPCMMLNMRFENKQMVKLFTQQKRNGVYFKVLEEGVITPFDEMILLQKDSQLISITDVVNAYYTKDKFQVEKVIQATALPEKLKKQFIDFL